MYSNLRPGFCYNMTAKISASLKEDEKKSFGFDFSRVSTEEYSLEL